MQGNYSIDLKALSQQKAATLSPVKIPDRIAASFLLKVRLKKQPLYCSFKSQNFVFTTNIAPIISTTPMIRHSGLWIKPAKI